MHVWKILEDRLSDQCLSSVLSKLFKFTLLPVCKLEPNRCATANSETWPSQEHHQGWQIDTLILIDAPFRTFSSRKLNGVINNAWARLIDGCF